MMNALCTGHILFSFYLVYDLYDLHNVNKIINMQTCVTGSGGGNELQLLTLL